MGRILDEQKKTTVSPAAPVVTKKTAPAPTSASGSGRIQQSLTTPAPAPVKAPEIAPPAIAPAVPKESFFSKTLTEIGGGIKSFFDTMSTPVASMPGYKPLTPPTMTVDGITAPVADPKQKALEFPIIGSNIKDSDLNEKSKNLDDTASFLQTQAKLVNKSDPKAIAEYNAKIDKFKVDFAQYNQDVKDYNTSQKFNFDTGKDARLASEIVSKDPTQTGFEGILKNSFIPTQFVNSADSALLNTARQEEYAKYTEEHPVLAAVAQGIGQMANLILIGKFGGGFNLSAATETAIGPGLANAFPTMTRILGLGAESGSIFGIESFINQAITQTSQKEFDPAKLATETVKGVASGAALGGAGALSTLPARIIAGGATLGGLTTLEKYLQEGKLTSKDITPIIVSVILGAGFEAVGGREKTDLFRSKEMNNIAREQTITRIMSNHPEMPREEAEKISSLINDLSYIVKSGYYQKAPAAYQEAFKNLPVEFNKGTIELKAEYFRAVSDEVLKGKTLTQAIDIVNQNPVITPTLKQEVQDVIKSHGGVEAYQSLKDTLGIDAETAKKIVLKVSEQTTPEPTQTLPISENIVEKASAEHLAPSEISAETLDSHINDIFAGKKSEIVPEKTEKAPEVAPEQKKMEEKVQTGLAKKVSDLYKQHYEKNKDKYEANDIFHKQYAEMIENPSRYNEIEQAPNPKGIKIGDHVTVVPTAKYRTAEVSPYSGTAVGISDESNAPAYEGGFSVAILHDSGGYPTHIQIADVEKGDEIITPKEEEPVTPEKPKPGKPEEKITKKRATKAKKSKEPEVYKPVDKVVSEKTAELQEKLNTSEGEYNKLTAQKNIDRFQKDKKDLGIEKSSITTIDGKEVTQGDFVQYGARVMLFDSVRDNGKILISDPGGRVEYSIPTDIKKLSIPSRGFVENEYARVEWPKTMGYDAALSKLPEEVDNEIEEGTIIDNENRSETIPDAGNVSRGENLPSGGEASSQVSGYDRAAMLIEPGNGPRTKAPASIGKKGRQLINEQVETLLDSKNYSTNSEDYTEEDRALMLNYTGAGGKEAVGAEGAGLLNEYYTPKPVISKIWEIAKAIQPEAETAFEPSAGIGSFISGSPVDVKVDGIEISKVSGTIASILNPESAIAIGDFQELFFDKKTNKGIKPGQYDMVIGNPPFGERAGFLKGKGEESLISREEEYFIKRGIDMLKERGHLIYVVNSGFLRTDSSKGKVRISENGALVAAYRLPENVFDDTSIGTDIVVFKKIPSDLFNAAGVRTISHDNYFKAHPENVLGETKIRKNRFGQTEGYVEGTLEEALKKIQIVKASNASNTEVKKTLTPKAKIEASNKPTVKTEDKTIKKDKKVQVTPPTADFEKLVIPSQDISNNKNTSPTEINMLRRINRDGSIPDPREDEMLFLNYRSDSFYGAGYFPDSLYFAGEIYEKLDKLKKDKAFIVENLGQAQYDKQKTGLEKAIPKGVPIKDIVFDPIDRHVAGMVTKTGDGEMTVLNAFSQFVRRNEQALSPRVHKYDVLRYVQGETMAKGTKPYMGEIKADAKRLFNHFIKNELDPGTQKLIEEKYNKEKNGYVHPDYSLIPVQIKNMAKDFRGQEFKLSQTQKEGVGFLVNKGSGLIAYGVGVGKTHTLAIATVANMQKGWAKKPVFAVPKSTISKTWLATLSQMFPGMTINNLEGLQAPVVARLKREKGADITKWIKPGELTIISHEGLLRLGFKEDELRMVAGDLTDALWQEPKTKRSGETQQQKYDEILGNAQKYVSDIMLSDLGIDHISVDEVHNFRKVFQGAKPEKEAGEGGKKRYANIVGGTPSRRAQQLFLISQYIQRTNGNRNVFLASATPFENHATEVYNVLSFIARDRMKEMGIMNINDFFSTFANFEVELDRKLTGEWVNREKMKSFSNLPALQSLLKEFIDYQEDETLVRPDRRVMTPHLPMGTMQTANLAKIQNLLNGVKETLDQGAFDDAAAKMYDVAGAEDGAFLKASTYSIANSVSPFFIKEYVGKTNPTAAEIVAESPKIQYAIEAIKTAKADPKSADFGTFLFFGKMGVEFHPMLADYIAKQTGYPREEVGVISGNITDDEKEEIKEKFLDGRIKVLLGGDQTKEGIDLQDNGFMTINLALGWNPTQISQVEGRVWRQGNNRSVAPLIYPLVENSGDATIFNKFEEKGGRINDLFSYKGKMFDVGEIDPAEKKLALLTDPRDKANMQIEIEKQQFFNESVLIDTDIKELNKIAADKRQTEGDIADYGEQVEKKEDRYGNEMSPEEIKLAKKELKYAKDRLDRIEARLENKNIKDIQAKISELEVQKEELKTKIDEINKTYEEKLKLFTEQYKEDIKNRKTIADHMEEIKGVISELKERTPEQVAAIRAQKIVDLEAKRLLSIPEFSTIEDHAPQITIKTLDRIGDRKTVSKQFIADLARKSDIKKVEKDVIEQVLADQPATVDVEKFRNDVIAELLPVKRLDAGDTTISGKGMIGTGGKYENIALPTDQRGNVASYQEHIYESPVKTSASDIHFRNISENYFGHTRTEDMADGTERIVKKSTGEINKPAGESILDQGGTRRIIEVQSDLYQKGRLENEQGGFYDPLTQNEIDQYDTIRERIAQGKEIPQAHKDYAKKIEKKGHDYELARSKEISKLQQYNDPTAHFRMVREEVKQAAIDGKTKLQFPTGETAMKIEGLGEPTRWQIDGSDSMKQWQPSKLTPENMKVGQSIVQTFGSSDRWIITDILGDGKFVAVPKEQMDMTLKDSGKSLKSLLKSGEINDYPIDPETFDISGKIDTQSPIYKFYQGELGKYLKNRYGATEITDAQGITWNEVKIIPDMATTPVEAFSKENTGETKKLTFEEGKARLEAYKKRLGLDFDVNFADTIFTGNMKADNTPEKAYAVTYNNKISLTNNILENTADHEMVHLVMNNINKISVFEGITRDGLLKAANGGKEYNQSQVTDLNEKIADGFAEYVRGKDQSRTSNILRRFYDRLLAALKKLFSALGVNMDIIQDFYRRLATATSNEVVKLEGQSELDKKVEFETADNRSIIDFDKEAVEKYQSLKSPNFEKIVEKAKDHSIDLRRKDINMLDEIMAQARDIYLKDPEEFKAADSFMKIGNERRMKKAILDTKFSEYLKPYMDAKPADRETVNEILMKGDEDVKEFHQGELETMGLNEPQIKAYQAVRKAFNVAHDLLLEEMAKAGVSQAEIDTFKGERIGYMPHKWAYKYAIKTQEIKPGNDVTQENGWKTENMDVFKTAREAQKAFEKLRAENKDPNTKRYVLDTLDNLDVDFFSEQRFSFENIKSVIAKAKTPQDVKDEMLRGLRNIIKEKGFGRQFIRRTGIQGYEKKEIPTIIANYFAGLNGFVTKMDAGKKYYGALETIDARRQSKFYAWVRNSIAYDMGQTKEFNGLKKVAFIYYLANDISFLLTNATQNWIVGVGELSKLIDSSIGKAYKGETALIKATTDWAIGNVTPEEKQVVASLLKVGRLGGETTAELMGFKNNPLYQAVSGTFNKVLYNSTAFIEQNVNRVPAFLAARRLLLEKGLTEKEANEQAVEVSDDINFRYGKQHRPEYVRGKKGIFFIFSHYMRSFLYQLARDLKEGEFMSLGKKMFYTALLGGATALPFASFISSIYHQIFGDDASDDTKAELAKWKLALERGLPAALTGVDLSQRVGINLMMFSNIMDDLAPGNSVTDTLKKNTETVLFDLVGAIGGLAIRGTQGIDLIRQGRNLEAGGKLFPDMIANPIKAYQGTQYGVFSQNGNPLIDENGQDFKYTTYEGFIKATGFTPVREQLAWDAQSKDFTSKQSESSQNAGVKTKIERLINQGDIPGARKYQEESRMSGELSSHTDYVRSIIHDKTINAKLDEWNASPVKNQATLSKMERQIAQQVYGDKVSPQQLVNIVQDFAFARTYGNTDKLANDYAGAATNAEKVDILRQARQNMGKEAFIEWFNKGRKTVLYPSGSTGTVLISDAVKELYIKSQ